MLNATLHCNSTVARAFNLLAVNEKNGKKLARNSFWILLTAGWVYVYRAKQSVPQGERLTTILLWSILGLFNINRILRHAKRFILTDGNFIIKSMLRPNNEINLSNIQSWSQDDYMFFGFITGNKIILNTKEGRGIDLWKQGNSSGFEKLSDYLNTSFEERYMPQLHQQLVR